MEHFRTNNTDVEYFEVENGEKVVCSCCKETLVVDEKYELSSTEVRILSGNNIIDHYHDEVITCKECARSSVGVEEWEDEVDETHYDPYAGCDVYEDYGDHDW